LKHVGAGDNAPDEINVVVEIPANTGPVKYEVDKADRRGVRRPVHGHGHVLSVQLRLRAGFAGGRRRPSGRDGGDAAPAHRRHGDHLPPISVLEMEDEAGDDAKIVAVPISKVARIYDRVQ
jgi:inorganic pyrophosphatase